MAAAFAALPAMRQALTAWLRDAGMPDPPRASVVLAVHEAAANAIEHSGSTEPVGVHGERTDDGFQIDIEDHGRWREPAPSPGDRGRGLALIHKLVSHAEVIKGTSGTIVRLLQIQPLAADLGKALPSRHGSFAWASYNPAA